MIAARPRAASLPAGFEYRPDFLSAADQRQLLEKQRASLVAELRLAYLLRGPSRTEREHGIPPVESLRYSITFRTPKAR